MSGAPDYDGTGAPAVSGSERGTSASDNRHWEAALGIVGSRLFSESVFRPRPTVAEPAGSQQACRGAPVSAPGGSGQGKRPHAGPTHPASSARLVAPHRGSSWCNRTRSPGRSRPDSVVRGVLVAREEPRRFPGTVACPRTRLVLPLGIRPGTPPRGVFRPAIRAARIHPIAILPRPPRQREGILKSVGRGADIGDSSGSGVSERGSSPGSGVEVNSSTGCLSEEPGGEVEAEAAEAVENCLNGGAS